MLSKKLTPKNVLVNNKLALFTLQTVKDNVINHNMPLYNPISLNGLNRGNRYIIFSRIFTKEFNSVYRGKYLYISCNEINYDKVRDKKLVIIENLDLLNNNAKLQEIMLEIVSCCLDKNIQIIFCLDNDIKNLEINDLLKTKLMKGLLVSLKK